MLSLKYGAPLPSLNRTGLQSRTETPGLPGKVGKARLGPIELPRLPLLPRGNAQKPLGPFRKNHLYPLI